MFFLVVGTLLLLEAPVAIYRQEAAWHWPTAPGQILSVGHSVRGGTSVKYNYFVAGKIYESSSGDLPHINRARLKAGNKITVRFSPDEPRVSVLDPGFALGRVFEALFGLFILSQSGVMAMLCISSYRNPGNTVWTFGWGRKPR